ncbi:glutamine synthetase [Sinorhizobium meliloti]|nr:glutamine synthetase [Sinorhizobium meliloti]
MSIDADDPEVFQSWLEQNGPIESIQAVICDLNGIMRGKRVPVEQARKVLGGGIRMPLSIVGVDVWGEDIIGSAQVFATGDRDGICGVTGRGALPVNWTSRPSALVPLWLFVENGRPFLADPRQALAAIMREYRELGCARGSDGAGILSHRSRAGQRRPADLAYTGKRLDSDAILSIDELDDFGEFFFRRLQGVRGRTCPADAAIAENGNRPVRDPLLHHATIRLKAADDAIFFKRIVKGVARKHGLAATFMAKPLRHPFRQRHAHHFSLLDEEGNNVFDDGQRRGIGRLNMRWPASCAAWPRRRLCSPRTFNSYRRLAARHACADLDFPGVTRPAPRQSASRAAIRRRADRAPRRGCDGQIPISSSPRSSARRS